MRMPPRREMANATDVFGPAQLRGVLRAGEDETAMPQFLCRTGEEFVQFLLTIGGVRAHVTQVALIPPEQATRVILLRFEGAIERQSTAGAELALELLQDR